MHHMDMPIDYHVWDAMLEWYQLRMLKLSSIMPPSWTTVLSMIRND